jgi:hypothetical protein
VAIDVSPLAVAVARRGGVRDARVLSITDNPDHVAYRERNRQRGRVPGRCAQTLSLRRGATG